MGAKVEEMEYGNPLEVNGRKITLREEKMMAELLIAMQAVKSMPTDSAISNLLNLESKFSQTNVGQSKIGHDARKDIISVLQAAPQLKPLSGDITGQAKVDAETEALQTQFLELKRRNRSTLQAILAMLKDLGFTVVQGLKGLASKALQALSNGATTAVVKTTASQAAQLTQNIAPESTVGTGEDAVNRAELRETYLQFRGAEFTRAENANSTNAAYVADPEGNIQVQEQRAEAEDTNVHDWRWH